jgi:GTP cyclohydrolase I
MEPAPLTHLKDTQNEPDFRNLPIDRVGVKALRFPMQIRDKAHATQHTVATAALTVDLPHHYKGTHMSRFRRGAERVRAARSTSITSRRSCRSSRSVLDSDALMWSFEFPFFLEKQAPVTGATGMMDYTARFSATLRRA